MSITRQSTLATLLIALLFIANCSGSSKPGGSLNDTAFDIATMLPELPTDDGNAVTSGLNTTELTGIQTFSRAPTGTSEDNDSLVIDSGEGGICWAMYKFELESYYAISQISVELTADPGNEAWVGLSNFTRNAWQFFEPQSSPTSHSVNATDSYLSTPGYLYVVVVSFDSNICTVESVEVEYEDNLFSISGSVRDNSLASPLGNVTVSAQIDETTLFDVTDSAGMYTIPGLQPGEYSVVASHPDNTFDPVSTSVQITSANVTNVSFVGTPNNRTYLHDVKQVFDAKCIVCHGSVDPSGNVALHTYWLAEKNVDVVVVSSVDNPHGGLNGSEKDIVQQWADNDEPFGLPVSYTNQAAAILDNNCISCHSGTPPQNPRLDSFAGASSVNETTLWEKVRDDVMPPTDTPLNDSTKDIFLAWIKQGRPE